MLHYETLMLAAQVSNTRLVITSKPEAHATKYFVSYAHSRGVYYWFQTELKRGQSLYTAYFTFDRVYSQNTNKFHTGQALAQKIQARVKKRALGARVQNRAQG